MKGYTLIELLATIVIMAIIVAIAVPIINIVIENVRKESFKLSAMNIAKSGDYTYANDFIKYSKRELIFTFEDSKINSNFDDAKLEFTGEIPQSGNVIIREDGKIALSAYNGKYCVQKDYNDSEYIISEKDIVDCYSQVSLPKLSLNGITPVNVEINTSYADEGVVATGIYGDPIETINKKVLLNDFPVTHIETTSLRSYKVVYSVQEGSKTNFLEREVNIVDTTPPVLTVPSDESLVISDVETFDLKDGVSVTDNSLEELEVTVIGGIAKIANTYQITYKVSDSSGNEATATRMISVSDISAPILTLNGLEEIDIQIGDLYVEQGASALDDADGDITANIITTGNVNTGVAGTYYITYTVTDSSNNQSSITRKINVIDNIAPTVTFGTNGNSSYVKATATTVNVTDNVSVATRYYMWTTSTTAPASSSFTSTFINGATIPTPTASGIYYLWIKATDQIGNETITKTNAFYLDNTQPVITVTNPSVSMTLTTAGYTDSGVTASDNVDGNLTSSISVTSNVNTRLAGTYTITYTVTDQAGNTKSATKTVTVNGYTEYRYRDSYESCSTCYNTCQSSTAATVSSYTCPGGYSKVGSDCVSNVYPSYSCSSGGSLSGSTCTLTASVSYTCPSGGSLSSSTCTLTQTASSYKYCSSGSLSGSSCYSVVSQGAGGTCPSGYYTADQGTCTKYLGAASTGYTCPSGYSRSGTTCTKTYSASSSCPSGYSMGTTLCTSRISGTPVYSCSSGTLSGSTCYSSYSCNPYSCNCSTSWYGWSAWSTTYYSSSGSRQVESRNITSI